ncbi:MAG: alkaline phosphatase family protein, partial [Prevotella sp.]|nr:alkaline phosphatase family protein [Prevotella sp.]
PSANIPPAIKDRIIMGYNPQRSGDIQIIVRSGYHGGDYQQGTTHGAWNSYDTHVPFILTGWHIEPGHTNKYVTISDIAPTICALLKIQMPTGCVGQPVL